MHRVCPVVKRLSLKTARVAEQEGFALMFGCINWLTLTLILSAGFGLLGMALLGSVLLIRRDWLLRKNVRASKIVKLA